MTKENTSVHVQIDDPIDLRKEILNCAIKFNQLLRDHENNRILRAKKEHYKNQVHRLLKQIKIEIKDLTEILPNVDIKLPKQQVLDLPKIIHGPTTPVIKEKPPEILDKFEREISEIKDKIRNL